MRSPTQAPTNLKISILGTRGIPAAHGGFETFAERLALFLVQRGWAVTVYCQREGLRPLHEDNWCGIRRVNIHVPQRGAFGTVVFDWKSTVHAAAEDSLKLTLGYNTAVFSVLYRLRRKVNLFNMDGIEWKREKWGVFQKAWLWLNEGLGCNLGHHLIADNPEIKRHLESRISANKISVIPYGSDAVERGDASVLAEFGLEPGGFVLVISRPEPENSILEIVRTFSATSRDLKLVVLGRYESHKGNYRRAVVKAAGPEVVFLGAIYNKKVVNALRYFSRLYVHGHRVGGTNPSLVEAMGAGSPILAHKNPYNLWVAGEAAAYFDDESDCRAQFDCLLNDKNRLQRMANLSRLRHAEAFTWERVLTAYEDILDTWIRQSSIRRAHGITY